MGRVARKAQVGWKPLRVHVAGRRFPRRRDKSPAFLRHKRKGEGTHNMSASLAKDLGWPSCTAIGIVPIGWRGVRTCPKAMPKDPSVGLAKNWASYSNAIISSAPNGSRGPSMAENPKTQVPPNSPSNHHHLHQRVLPQTLRTPRSPWSRGVRDVTGEPSRANRTSPLKEESHIGSARTTLSAMIFCQKFSRTSNVDSLL